MEKIGPKDEKKPVKTPETKAPKEEDEDYPTDGVTDHKITLDDDGWADP